MDISETDFLSTTANNYLSGKGRFSAAVGVLQSGEFSSFDIAGNAKKRSASVIKLYIMLTFLKKKGDERITNNEYELLSDMITMSDNDATNTLIDMLGIDAVNKTIAKYGFDSTRLERKMLDFDAVKSGLDNYTGACDTIRFLKMVFCGEFGREISDIAFEILKEQKNRTKLARFLPSGVIFAGKAGELDPEEKRGGVENDSGIIVLSDKVLFVTVLISDANDTVAAADAIASFSKAVYDFYNTKG